MSNVPVKLPTDPLANSPTLEGKTDGWLFRVALHPKCDFGAGPRGEPHVEAALTDGYAFPGHFHRLDAVLAVRPSLNNDISTGGLIQIDEHDNSAGIRHLRNECSHGLGQTRAP